MNIVIIGAGAIGLHLARLFSQMNYGIVLVDTDPLKLEQASRELDVATRLGSGADWELLETILELSPDLLIALTNNDEINLVACSIAKNLGYKQTIARARKESYFSLGRLNFEKLFSVDYIIAPEKLTAEGIVNMILMPHSIATENFAHGSIQMRTMKIPSTWRKEKIPLLDREKLGIPKSIVAGLIKREGEEEVFFPQGSDCLLPGDEVTFLGQAKAIRDLHKFLGISIKLPKSVMIIGGSLIGINLARSLQENDIRVTLLEKDFDKCHKLSELLPDTTIIHRDGTDYRFLQAEKVNEFALFVSCVREDEINFLAAAVAKDLGCREVIITLSDTSYIPLAQKLDIGYSTSARIFAANRILSIAKEKSITSIIAMYENQAEIIEIKVSMDSKITGIPIHQLGPQLPKDFLIVVIQSRGRVFIADSTRVLSPGDIVIVICNPKHVNDIKKIF